MRFSLLEFSNYDGHWWVSLLFAEGVWWQGALLHVEYGGGCWKWDLLWLGDVVRSIREKRA